MFQSLFRSKDISHTRYKQGGLFLDGLLEVEQKVLLDVFLREFEIFVSIGVGIVFVCESLRKACLNQKLCNCEVLCDV